MNTRILNFGISLMIVLSFGFAISAPAAAADLYVYEGDSIQDAIDVAVDGDVIHVHEGTYSENLEIDGVDISLIAVGDVTIDGSTNGFSHRTIFIRNATCTIDGFTVKHNGSAIYARGMTSLYGDGKVDVTIKNNTVKDYIKNGITINGELAEALVKDNTVLSYPDVVYAQNGIQFGYGATGQALRNTVTTDWYLGDGWTACGILIFESDNVSVQLNNVSNAQTGIGIEAWGWLCPSASKNVVSTNTIDESSWGITVTAYSWSYSTMDCSANNNKITNNYVTTSEGDIGIYVGAAYISGDYTPEADNNKAIHNTISGFDSDVINDGSATKIQANRTPYN